MGNCWAKYACDYAESMIGAVCGGKGVYSDIVGEMDSVSFYNYPKNGEANSCKIFVDNCILHACTDPSFDEDPEGAKWTALYMVNEPQAAGANDGAGCAQSVRMYQAMGAWYEDNFERGDEIYYRRDSAVSPSNPLGVYHTGIIVAWGSFDELDGKDGYKVVEGNTTYEGEKGRVGVRYIEYGDSRIAGAGRPRYDGWEPDDEDVKPEPTPEPEPEPTPSPDRYEVTTNGGVLRLRAAPNTSSAYLIGIPNGTELEVTDIVEGESIDYVTDWARTCYAGYNGFVSCRWITKI